MSSLNLTLDPLSLVENINEFERERLNRVKTVVSAEQRRTRFDNDLTRDLSTDRRELAAMALARSQGAGPSVAGFQTAEAQRGLEEQRLGAGSLREAGAQAGQVAQQQSQVAQQGAQARMQESQQALGAGLGGLAQDARVQMMRDIKERELATTLASMFMQNEARQGIRDARMQAAERGIQADEMVGRINRQAQQRGRAIAGGATLLGTGLGAWQQSQASGGGQAPGPAQGEQSIVNIAGESPIVARGG